MLFKLSRHFAGIFPPIVLLLLLTASAGRADAREALDQLNQNVRFYRLENGLRVLMYRRGEAPVFFGSIVVRVGGVDEAPGYTGISHMFEHMAFKGTTSVGTTDYARERRLLDQLEAYMQREAAGEELDAADRKQIEEINGALEGLWHGVEYDQEMERRGGLNNNAMTTKDATKYYVGLPRNQFEFWCWIEAERIMHPVMRQFYKERDVVMEERRMRFENDPFGKLFETVLGVVYHRHPYSYPVIGFESDIRTLTAAQTEEFRHKYYVPGNLVIAVVGDIDPDRDIETIKKYFGKIPPGPVPPAPRVLEAEQEGERSVTIEHDASPQLLLAYRKVQYPHPDSAALSVMLEAMVGGRTSPLYKELVQRREVATSIDYSEQPGELYPNLAMFFAEPRHPHTNAELLQIFDQEVEKFKSHPIDAAALEIVRRRVAMAYLKGLRSSESLAMDLASNEALYNDWRVSSQWFDQLMRVSAADVQRVARQYLVPKNRTIGRVEQPGGKS